MVLETERLIIETMDLPCLDATARGDAEAMARMGYNVDADWPGSVYLEILPYLRDVVECQGGTGNGFGPWIVIDRYTRHAVGSVGFAGDPDENGNLSLGLGFLPAERRKGYAFEAMSILIEWAFSHASVFAIEAECRDSNTAAIRLFIKLGFTETARAGTIIRWKRLPSLSVLSHFF